MQVQDVLVQNGDSLGKTLDVVGCLGRQNVRESRLLEKDSEKVVESSLIPSSCALFTSSVHDSCPACSGSYEETSRVNDKSLRYRCVRSSHLLVYGKRWSIRCSISGYTAPLRTVDLSPTSAIPGYDRIATSRQVATCNEAHRMRYSGPSMHWWLSLTREAVVASVAWNYPIPFV